MGATVGVVALAVAGAVYADIPNRVGVRGTVPNPGTQQQELANITFPWPYNVFEFIVTCGACHGGTVDQQVAHMGNWGGTAMASAARDPVFRANQMIVNAAIRDATGEDGAGNMCFRCHSPNGWYSGRFDPTLAGAADGSTMLHSILLSTDDEGIACEACHRTMGGVTHRRGDLDPNDPAWNMLGGVGGYPGAPWFDPGWPHDGMPYVDQDGHPTLAPGNPYGDTTLQFADGMTYIGRYAGTANISWSDVPLVPGSPYTGQTYGVYPGGWFDALGNDLGGQPAIGPDGVSPVIQLDVPVGPPMNPNGTPNYAAQSMSPEHTTVKFPNMPPAPGFLQTSEFCGTCHDLTIPILNHGMPEQRTYTEWKYSAYGREGPEFTTCQQCHMPRLSHEYTDDAVASFSADPVIAGGFPYAKSRTNTAVHKLAGANRDLPEMMKALYREVDFEVIGGAGVEGGGNFGVGTGNDPRIFPGMLSDRTSMWERNRRNTDVSLRDAVDVEIVAPPTLIDEQSQTWKMQVKVVNRTGHRLPSGYPDGRRMFLGVLVTDANDVPWYESGWYDDEAARLYTDSARTELRRALTNEIDQGENAVMVYERVTGTCVFGERDRIACEPSLSLLNDHILFDNRIPPFGFSYEQYRQSGVKFYTYDPDFIPTEDPNRYAGGQNFDVVTYTFRAPADAQLSARAEVFYQSHTREFMDHLRRNDTSWVRPQGPPRPWAANYPLQPNYLSDEFDLVGAVLEARAAGFLGPQETLNDNWGGIAYASWFRTGRGAPFPMAAAEVVGGNAAQPPGAVVGLHVYPEWTVGPNGSPVPIGGIPMQIAPDVAAFIEPFTQVVTWTPVAGADGYLVRIKYGKPGTTTASWDKLAIVPNLANQPDCGPAQPFPCLVNTAINVNKTYTYTVQAFSGGGSGPESVPVSGKTPWDIPFEPLDARCTTVGDTWVDVTWFDQTDNELGFLIENQLVPLGGPAGPVTWTLAADVPALPAPPFGGMTFRVEGLLEGRTYVWQVGAYNASGILYSLPFTCIPGGLPAPQNLTARVFNAQRVDLAWIDGTEGEARFVLERALDPEFLLPLDATFVVTPAEGVGSVVLFSDTTVSLEQYFYRVIAVGPDGVQSAPSNVVQVLVADPPPVGSISPAAISGPGAFPRIRWGAVSPPRTVTVSNLGTGRSLRVDGIALAGANPTDFLVDPGGTCVDGGLVPALGSCTILVRFSPTGVGLRTATLQVATNDPLRPILTVDPVEGTGAYPIAGVSPPSLPFPLVFVSRQSGPLNVTLSNAGNEALLISSIAVNGTNAADFLVSSNGCGASLAPGASCAIGVTFAPTAAGPRAATLAVVSNDPVNPQLGVSLSGTGTLIPPPEPPSALTAAAPSWAEVVLSWSDNSIHEDGFRVQRATAGGAFATVATLGPNVTTYRDTTVLPNATYDYRVVAFNVTGEAASATVTVTVPPAPPAAPTALTATLLPPTSVRLAWTDASSNETGFTIERSTASTFTANVVTFNAAANATVYTDTTVAANTRYYYRIRAFNGVGTSAWSPTATVLTSGGTPPAAPVSLEPVVATRTSIQIRWTDRATNEQGFYVERSGSPTGPWTRVATLAANTVQYTNAGLLPNTAYSYRVQAFNAGGTSAYSNVITFRTLP
jgi:fibronectin type 3 domain-containing protein